MCRRHGVKVTAVTKGVCADERIVRAMIDGGCSSLADSRIDNIKRLREAFPSIDITLLRIPMKDEISYAVRYADCSTVSMPEAIDALEAECKAQNTSHSVLLMFDLGDRREGALQEESELFANLLSGCSRVSLRGVGVNFGCFAGVLPSQNALAELSGLRLFFERKLGYTVPLCSGGSTSSLMLTEKNELPQGVSGLRIGEGILLGQDVTWQRSVPWLRQDTFELEAQIIELRLKPSMPEGERGANAFGEIRGFSDRGKRLRAIAAIGRQDFSSEPESLTPLAEGVKVLGASSDHMILDVTDAEEHYRWGDIISFSLNYSSMLGLMTSPYVEKVYL